MTSDSRSQRNIPPHLKRLLVAINDSGGSISWHEADDAPRNLDNETIEEANRRGFIVYDTGGGWDTVIEVRLSPEGIAALRE